MMLVQPNQRNSRGPASMDVFPTKPTHRVVVQTTLTQDGNPRHEEGKESNEPEHANTRGDSTSSFAAFRDFFLAAFSDGYHNALYCGDHVPACCGSNGNSKKDKRWATEDDYSLKASRSSTSHDTTSLQLTPSQDTRRSRRKKPLAVAVGFKYAEDPRGRPIVVTPGRTSDVSSTSSSSDLRISPPRSPPDVPRLRNPSEGLPPVCAMASSSPPSGTLS
mmetsp:Transcript_3263/g.6948  ORF Transcript_3263/g.6948 Transcript_3263/m.6948 type:complete len:219 (+) Transcript_3263:124-780(+)